MKRLSLAPFVLAVLLALTAGAAFAANPPQAQPAISQDPTAAPAVQRSLPDLLADLLQPAAAVSEEALPQSIRPCVAYSFCQQCPEDVTAQLCFVVQCGAQKTISCGDCVPDCMTIE